MRIKRRYLMATYDENADNFQDEMSKLVRPESMTPNNTQTERKACPFCGNQPIQNSKDSERINCSLMGCYQSEAWRDWGFTLEDWNARPLEDALNEQITKQSALIEMMGEIVEMAGMEFGNADFIKRDNAISVYKLWKKENGK
jgi:hypothetical protein